MNNLRPDFNITAAVAAGAAAQRRRERQARWGKALRKSLGTALQRTGRCKIWMASLFHAPVETPATWRIERCPHCYKRRGIIDNGFATTQRDPEEIEREVGI